ncbi:MAG TPA: DUF502 domain-containing protein [Opitutales bacterium]|jgi:uncharacterized membrane protein|nr:DUF502 domain-containing protein [Opitutales bacterium]
MSTHSHPRAARPKLSKWLKFRNAFITGLFLLAPLGVCAFVINFLLQNIGNPSSNLFFGWMKSGHAASPVVTAILSIVAIIIVVMFVTALGYASHYFFGRWMLRRAELLILRVPILNQVYRTTKQIMDAFHSQQKEGFDNVVLIEFPREGLYTIGFVTKATEGEVRARTGEDYVNVFVPTTPMPTNGFLVICREKDLIRLDMSVGDGMKLIISGGAIAPPYTAPAKRA